MAEDELERPDPKGAKGWPTLYRARGADVGDERPVFTGDVFAFSGGSRHVQLLQHPCALRVDGLNLLDNLLVAEVCLDVDGKIPDINWRGSYRLMPLPALVHGDGSEPTHYFADFVSLNVVKRTDIETADRIACLSQTGVNLLLQRWLHHNSRVIIPTFKIQEVAGGPFDEADLIEEWCEETAGPVEEATAAALDWLREETSSGSTRQATIAVPQNRSAVRQEMRQHLRAVRAAAS